MNQTPMNDQQLKLAALRELRELTGQLASWLPEAPVVAQHQRVERRARGRRRAQRDARQIAEEPGGTDDRMWTHEWLRIVSHGPKEVWLARRSAERAMIDDNEYLRTDRLDRYTRWQHELALLSHQSPGDEPEPGDVSDVELTHLWVERKRLAEQRARELLAQPAVQAALGGSLAGHSRQPAALVQALVPVLRPLAPAALAELPVLYAAAAISVAATDIG